METEFSLNEGLQAIFILRGNFSFWIKARGEGLFSAAVLALPFWRYRFGAAVLAPRFLAQGYFGAIWTMGRFGAIVSVAPKMNPPKNEHCKK